MTLSITVSSLLSGTTDLTKTINDINNNNNTVHVECKSRNDTSNNRGSRNNLKVIQKVPEQYTWKARQNK